MCNNVRNGFKDEKCPKRLSKAGNRRPEVGGGGGRHRSLCGKPLPRASPAPAQAPPSSGSLARDIGIPQVTSCPRGLET